MTECGKTVVNGMANRAPPNGDPGSSHSHDFHEELFMSTQSSTQADRIFSATAY